MPNFLSIRGALLAATAMAAALPAFADTLAVPPPPLSTKTAKYFAANPGAYAALMARLAPATPAAAAFTTSAGGTWSLVRGAPGQGLCNPVLLTDGTVLVASCNTPDWYRLTPDQAGNYETGAWSQIASLPSIDGTQYGPLYHASAVLPDGRYVISGGEYNNGPAVWTNLGAILDPVANQWTALAPPVGNAWTNIGDAQSVLLESGQWLLGSCCSFPAEDALLRAKTLSWASVQAPQYGGGYQDEQGYELLPNGRVLTIDVWSDIPSFELFDPTTMTWKLGGTTPTLLPDPPQCGTYEMGPTVVRGDGTVVAFGGHSCAVNGSAADPTAVYTVSSNSWIAGPNVPATCGRDGTKDCTLADAPAALLPNGNILFAASAGFAKPGTHFFEFGTDNSITQVSDPLLHAPQLPSYAYFFLVLPTAQVMVSDFSGRLELYTPAGAPVASWAPKIASAPKRVTRGQAYTIVGSQLGGRSAGAYYGDDAQMATNFPIVRIRNVATGHVFYGRTSNFTVSVAPNALGQTKFTLPANAETGSASLEVVGDGIASAPVPITVR